LENQGEKWSLRKIYLTDVAEGLKKEPGNNSMGYLESRGGVKKQKEDEGSRRGI